jgi:signal peptidase II
MRSRLHAFLAVLAVIIPDRASKLWITSSLSSYDAWVVIPGFLNIVHSENPGMAFGFLSDHESPWRSFLLVGVSLAILIVLLRLLLHTPVTARRQILAIALVIGGACGNLFDRIVRGSVTDFIDVHLGVYHWPTFNLADSAITVGALVLMVDLWLQRGQQTEPAVDGKGGSSVP